MVDHTILDQFEYDGDIWGQPTTLELLDRVKTLELDPRDVIVATYTKSGTTWMKYIVSLIHHGEEGEEHNEKDLLLSVPYLEFLLNTTAEEIIAGRLARPSPRLFSTHTGATHLQKQVHENKVKIVAVMRNPKDTLVSYYHFYRMNAMLGNFSGTFSEWFDLVRAKRLMGGDIFEYNLKWWRLRNLDNVLVVFYEDMIQDPCREIQKVATFCGKTLTEEQIRAIAQKSSFKHMKGNEKVNHSMMDNMSIMDFSVSPFMRKGEVGDWRNYFTVEQSQYIDKRCQEEWEPEGLRFVYDINLSKL